jgi:hypothetical protein
MRQIKFRAGDGKKKAYLCASDIMHTIASQWHISVSDQNENVLDLERTQKFVVLEQFTGLHDKNGKEAYHKDFYKSPNGRMWIIEYGPFTWKQPSGDSDLFGWYLQSVNGRDQLPIHTNAFELAGEVIGNIHENPELLSTQKGEKI